MDRNYHRIRLLSIDIVALRKESVDRNSSRCLIVAAVELVALRKESVDRNCQNSPVTGLIAPSLSARRAWIEIARQVCMTCRVDVALRKESVDRNGLGFRYHRDDVCRSPQGERG